MKTWIILGVMATAGCQSPPEAPSSAAGTPPVVSGNLDRMAAISGEVKSAFACTLQLETAASGAVMLVADLSLGDGNYIASPFSPDTVLGHFRFEIVEGPVKLSEGLDEAPVPPLTFDPQLEQQVRWATGQASYSQAIEVPADEFNARGEVFFVLEPACTPRVLPFDIWRDGEGLHLEQRPGC